jgi:hypothetical protein
VSNGLNYLVIYTEVVLIGHGYNHLSRKPMWGKSWLHRVVSASKKAVNGLPFGNMDKNRYYVVLIIIFS